MSPGSPLLADWLVSVTSSMVALFGSRGRKRLGSSLALLGKQLFLKSTSFLG